MLPNNDALTNAFRVLAATVRDFDAQSRPCLGATLKPTLNNRAGINEQLFGFRKFGDFLRAAQAAGYVQLRPTSGGDIGVFTPINSVDDVPLRARAEVPTSTFSPPPGPSATIGVRVRQDLWNAFNSYSANWVYDPDRDLAFKDSDSASNWAVPVIPRPNLVSIPSGRERVVERMGSYANLQDPEIGRQLLDALNGPGGPYHLNYAYDQRPERWSRSADADRS
jgi:hypothetical protein